MPQVISAVEITSTGEARQNRAAAASSVAVTSTGTAKQNKARAADSAAVVTTTAEAKQNKAEAGSTVAVTTTLAAGYTLYAGTGGTGYFLIRGTRPALASAPGEGVTDVDGVVLVDENGDVLIWG